MPLGVVAAAARGYPVAALCQMTACTVLLPLGMSRRSTNWLGLKTDLLVPALTRVHAYSRALLCSRSWRSVACLPSLRCAQTGSCSPAHAETAQLQVNFALGSGLSLLLTPLAMAAFPFTASTLSAKVRSRDDLKFDHALLIWCGCVFQASSVARGLLFALLHPLVLCAACAFLQRCSISQFLVDEAVLATEKYHVLLWAVLGIYLPVYCTLASMVLATEAQVSTKEDASIDKSNNLKDE